MDSLKKLLSDALGSIALAGRAAARLAAVAIPMATRIAAALGRLARNVLSAARGTDYRKKADEVRRTAKKGQKAITKLASEAEARRTGRKRREDRLRKYGIAGAVAAGVIAIVLYIPRKLMERSEEPSAPKSPASTVPPAGAPADPATPSAETPGANTGSATDGAQEPEPASERPST